MTRKFSITDGKAARLDRLSNDVGVLTALAMDQRGSLRKTISNLLGRPMTDDELAAFKAVVSRALTPHASAVLLDPQYGGEALKQRASNCGVILSYEETGYDTTNKGRMLRLPPHLSVRRLVEQGADGVKVMVYYDPDDDAAINDQKHTLIERIGAECAAEDVVFFLEPYTYTDVIADEKSLDYARVRPHKVLQTMRDFSAERFRVDVLKVEVPVNMKYVEGTSVHAAGTPFAQTRTEALEAFRAGADATHLPFIYLSGGVSDALFRETISMALESGAPFSGVLCGRATWQDGIPEFVKSGADGFFNWLSTNGVERIRALNVSLEPATPWRKRLK
ncbi:MAG: tagatose 1,6-diphosphate aldolase [Chloroflexi bacterium]|nr:tagatose 1,6-diphosphate aldolase [Chloroflexota bacterium]